MKTEFRSLVDQHRDRIYTFAYYNLGNREEAEDVTQEVLIRLWKNLEGIHMKTLPAWLTRVTKNACIDTVRRRRAYESRVVANGEHDHVALAPAGNPTPEATAHAGELREQIQRALSTLKEPYRSIVILREVQDQKYEQICEAMDLPLNTVKSYLHRGRRMLREKLRGMVDHDSF
jgi:RNA polymerase sigma-70 factor (ECF subfamily)